MRYGIGYSGHNPPESVIELQGDGRVRLFIGSIDMGQGTDTALALIAARESGAAGRRGVGGERRHRSHAR